MSEVKTKTVTVAVIGCHNDANSPPYKKLYNTIEV
jgi:hypothetical protein